MYCDAPDSPRRRATQFAMHKIFDALCRLLAPVLVFTAEEAWAHRHPERNGAKRNEVEGSRDETVKVAARAPSTPLRSAQDDGVFTSIRLQHCPVCTAGAPPSGIIEHAVRQQ